VFCSHLFILFFSYSDSQDRTTDIRCKKRCDILLIRKAGVVELAKEKPEILQYFVKKTIQSIFEHLKSLEYSYKYE
jgi:hypothetical protein